MDDFSKGGILKLTVDIVSAYVGHNQLSVTELPGLLQKVHDALDHISGGETSMKDIRVPLIPAVPIKKSITDDYLISLENGQKFKSLKRHLMTHYGMTPDQYRAKWGLPSTYPMVAPNYANSRSALAHSFGLGQKAAVPESALVEPAPVPKIAAKKTALEPAVTETVPVPVKKPRRGRPAKAA